MVTYWLAVCSPKNIREVEIVFPVTGHSFLPADRVFGVIEKELRKTEVTSNPDQYIDVIRKHSSIQRLGGGL